VSFNLSQLANGNLSFCAEFFFCLGTLRSSCLATQGWQIQSLWDWLKTYNTAPNYIRHSTENSEEPSTQKQLLKARAP
jgi:hypothetical protein